LAHIILIKSLPNLLEQNIVHIIFKIAVEAVGGVSLWKSYCSVEKMPLEGVERYVKNLEKNIILCTLFTRK